MTEPIVADFFRHNLWANLQVLDACAGLPDEALDATVEGTYGSIRDTLVHLLSAEARYTTAFTDEQRDSPLAETGPFPGFDALRQHAKASGEALIEQAASSPPDRILTGTYRGQPYEMRAAILFTHAIDHAVEHRTHIETILTQQGIEPPETDGITYFQSGGP
jgi:uncharacterized damage-inducible protein DinB